MSGWVKIHRNIENCLFYGKPDHMAVWIHLLLFANFSDRKTLVGNKIIMVKRGQILISRRELSLKTGVQESKCERILTLMKSEQKIEQQPSSKFRLITVLNYETYQVSEQQVNSKRTASEQQVNSGSSSNARIKNVKNVKNKDLKANPLSSRPDEQDEPHPDDLKLFNSMLEALKSKNPKFRTPNKKSWINVFRLTREQDGRTATEIWNVFWWAHNDSFWSSNILSPEKLRKQYDTLFVKMNQDKGGNGNYQTNRRENTHEIVKRLNEQSFEIEQSEMGINITPN